MQRCEKYRDRVIYIICNRLGFQLKTEHHEGDAITVLLGFGAVQTSALKMDTVCFSETFSSIYESPRRQNPEERHHVPHRRENLKSRIMRKGVSYLLSVNPDEFRNIKI
jgi:hypothetical protein